jgi:hypothetical protein
MQSFNHHEWESGHKVYGKYDAVRLLHGMCGTQNGFQLIFSIFRVCFA